MEKQAKNCPYPKGKTRNIVQLDIRKMQRMIGKEDLIRNLKV